MQSNFFQTLFILATFLGATGILIIILSRDTVSRASKLFILLLVLIYAYLISHGIHFLLMYNKEVTNLDISCHSFLLLILVTLTFFTLDFPKSHTISKAKTLLILLPSLILLILLWNGDLIKESHVHNGVFRAQYNPLYLLYLIWYVILIVFSIFVTLQKINKEKDRILQAQLKVFLYGLIITNLFSFAFGLFLPWFLGFYFLVEVSPLAFLTGVILFSAIGIGKFNMFPASFNKINNFSINRKMFLGSLIVVPIIILIVQIPLGKVLFGIETNVELFRYFMISLFVGIIVSISITFIILQVISNPLNKLKLIVHEIENGKLGTQIEFVSNDEIGELSTAFNRMSSRLKVNAEELEAKKNRINLLLDAFQKSSAAIAIIDANLMIIEANHKFAEFIGDTLSTISGKKLNMLKFFDDPDFFDNLFRVNITEKMDNEEYYTKKSKDEKTILVTFTKVTLLTGVSGYLFVGLDISEKKKLEKQLSQSEKLATLGKMSAVLAHEIKTPLTSIKLNVDMLCETSNLSVEDRAAYEIIRKEINRMNNLVNEVLRFSKPVDLIYSKADIAQLFQYILAEVRNKINLKNITIVNRVDSKEIEVDTEKIKQVLLNLIDNSFEAAGKGGTIEFYSSLNSDVNRISLYIKDDGCVIPDTDKIFEPFFTTKASGTGLGLAISKKIIEQHKGEIRLLQSNDSGSVFEIILPVIKE